MNNCIHIVSLLVKLHRNCAECMVVTWTMNNARGKKKKLYKSNYCFLLRFHLFQILRNLDLVKLRFHLKYTYTDYKQRPPKFDIYVLVCILSSCVDFKLWSFIIWNSDKIDMYKYKDRILSLIKMYIYVKITFQTNSLKILLNWINKVRIINKSSIFAGQGFLYAPLQRRCRYKDTFPPFQC